MNDLIKVQTPEGRIVEVTEFAYENVYAHQKYTIVKEKAAPKKAAKKEVKEADKDE